jgi:hypothetical protein
MFLKVAEILISLLDFTTLALPFTYKLTSNFSKSPFVLKPTAPPPDFINFLYEPTLPLAPKALPPYDSLFHAAF